MLCDIDWPRTKRKLLNKNMLRQKACDPILFRSLVPAIVAVVQGWKQIVKQMNLAQQYHKQQA